MDKNNIQNDDVQGTELQKVEETTTELETRGAEEERRLFLKQLENFTSNLNKKPTKVAKHQGYLYIPVSTIEKDLAKLFFGLVQYEVISYQQILNEFVVQARVKVYHPIIKEWLNYDGLGCGMFQQKADTPIQDFYMYKTKNAGKLTVPNAYAEAIKNAAKKIGKRFGSDLNRALEDDYSGFFKEEPIKVDESNVINK